MIKEARQLKTTKRIISLALAVLCVGTLCVSGLSGSADAAELGYEAITKVLATTSGTPVASSNAYEITGATSTPGAVYYGLSWYDSAGNFIDGAFTTDYATVDLRLDAAAGYYFAEGLQAYLNNSAVDYTIYDNGAYIILRRTYAPEVWAPTIIKHPGSERVDEGSWCSFVATASGAEKCEWRLTAADGKTYSMQELMNTFSGMTYSDDTLGKLILRGIPRELDGSKVYCIFTGAGGSSDTKSAALNVDYEKPSPSPTPAPTPTPTASAAPGGEDKADGGDADAAVPGVDPNHEHSYGRAWIYDDERHWHECECGDKSADAGHVMTWEIVREATKKQPGEEQGECGVCDYEATREIEYVKPAEDGKWILYVGIGAIVLVLVLMIASTAKQKRAARRRAAARRRRYYEDDRY